MKTIDAPAKPVGQKVADCTVRHSEEWFEVQSPRGNIVRVTATDYDNNWDSFTPEESALIDRIFAGPSDRRMVLTSGDMRLVLGMQERARVETQAKVPQLDISWLCQKCATVKTDADNTWVEADSDLSKALGCQGNVCRSCMEQHAPKTPSVIIAHQLATSPVETNGHADAPVKDAGEKTARQTAGAVIRRSARGSRAKEREVNDAEVKISTLQEAVRKVSGGMNMLIYDIPSVLRRYVKNPSKRLWHVGFRLNLSCWVLPDRGLESTTVKSLLKKWEQFQGERLGQWAEAHHEEMKRSLPSLLARLGRGVEVHIIPYHPDAIAQIKKIASDKLDQEIRRVHTSLVTKIGRAADLIDAARKAAEEAEKPLTQRQQDDLEGQRVRKTRSAIRKACRELEAVIACAQTFDETERAEHLLTALRQAIVAQAEAFNAEAVSRGVKTAPVPAA